ncbi:outer membrane beta-barrel protein [Ferruginibacter sp. SUN002]|uniref:outer membrane beta-barrel protein n=1 Tax=Ferruginibacter sp. SUN002 TaxID=2937789 RepID=UPI003D36E60F
MKTTLLLFLTFTTVFATAQNSPIYAKLDFGSSNVKTNNGKGNGNFAFGIGLETYLHIQHKDEVELAVNPVLSYLKTGYESTTGGKVIVNYLTLAAPLSIVVHSPGSRDEMGLAFGAGPFVGIAASGKFKVLAIDDFKKMSFGNGTEDNRKSMDAGLTFKASVRAKKLNLGIQYNIGVVNLIPKDRISNGAYIKSKNFLFYASYAIFDKKK